MANGKGGPKSARGKAIVARNAVRHGVMAAIPVIPGMERAEDWEFLRAGVLASLAPEGALETELAERVAHLLWRLRRAGRFETAALCLGQDQIKSQDTELSATYDGSLDSAHESAPATRAPRLRAEHLVLHMQEVVSQFQALAKAPSETLLSTLYLEGVFTDGRDAGDEVVTLLGELYTRSDCSVGVARAAVEQAFNLDFDDWLSNELSTARALLSDARLSVRRLAARANYVRGIQLVPDSAHLEKLMRYEAHLNRQLMATLHELEAFQARRRGQATPLVRLDITNLPSA